MKRIALAILAVVVVAAGLVALYQGGWWLKEDSVNRTSQINNDSYARQTGLNEAIIGLYSQVTDLDIRAAGDVTEDQRIAILTGREGLVDELCSKYAQTTGTATLPANIHAFAAQEC